MKHLDWADFMEVPEYEVETILRSRWHAAKNGQKIEELLTKFVGYDLNFNEWLTRRQLKNAPQKLQEWDEKHIGSRRRVQNIQE